MTITQTSATGGTFTESVTAKYSYYDGGPTGTYLGSSPFLTNTVTGDWFNHRAGRRPRDSRRQ